MIDNSNTKLVSFIIAAYNVENYIIDCIDSCLNQTYPNIEVIITDDGSTDRTYEIVLEKYGNNNKVIIDKFITNQKKIAAFNNSFSKAKGEYIAIIGADDINHQNRIKHQLEMIDDAVVSICNMSVFSNNINKIIDDNFTKNNVNQVLDFDTLSIYPFGLGSILIKKNIADNIFPIPKDIIHEDYFIPVMASIWGNVVYLGKSLYFYRVHDKNTSGIFQVNKMQKKNLIEQLTRDRFYHLRASEFFKKHNKMNESFYSLFKSNVLFAVADKNINTTENLESIWRSLSQDFINKNRKIIIQQNIKLIKLAMYSNRFKLALLILKKLQEISNYRFLKLKFLILFKISPSKKQMIKINI